MRSGPRRIDWPVAAVFAGGFALAVATGTGVAGWGFSVALLAGAAIGADTLRERIRRWRQRREARDAQP